MSGEAQHTLLASRYTAPTIAFNAIERTALLKELEGDALGNIIVVAAPAGSGKTALLAQYAARNPQGTCWYTVGPSTADSSRFWSYVVHAFARVAPNLPTSALLQAFSRRSFEKALPQLLNTLGSIEKPMTLVVDGTQNIASAELWDEIGYFCDNIPLTLRVVLSGRCMPRLPLSRMALEGRTSSILFSRMAFSVQEASRLYSSIGFSPSATESANIFENTQGWPALVMAMAQAGKAATLHRDRVFDVVDNPIIYDFLHEEVLDNLPSSTLRFLELTSILPYFSESDCREFLAQVDEGLARETQQHVKILHRDQALFERPVGRGYRCNPVIARFLKRNLALHDKDAYRSTCNAMATMLEARDNPNGAIPLALEGENWPLAIRLILASYSRLGMTAGFIDLVKWLEQIPAEYFDIYPELNIAKAMALIPTGKVKESEGLLNRAETLLQAQKAEGVRPANDFMVHCEIPIIRAYNNAFTVLQGDDLLLYSAQAQQELGENRNLAIEGSVMLMNGIGNLLTGNYQEAEECLTTEMERMGESASTFTPLLATYYLAMLEYQRGNLRHAEDLLQEALQSTSKDDGMREFLGIFHVLLAWTLYDQNRLDECLEHALEGLTESREWAAQTSLPDAYEVLICAYLALGGDSEAKTLDRQRRRDVGAKYPLFAHLSLAHPRNSGFLHPKSSLPKASLGMRRLWFQRQMVHKLIADGNRKKLATALKTLGNEARDEGLLAYVLEAQALNSVVLAELGDEKASLESLQEALEIAEENGHVQVFLDEGDAMRTVLRSARQAGIAPGYVSRLLRLFPGDAPEEAVRLSQRELDVLTQLAQGLTPKQIAAELYVSIGTVRTHLHHIYGKLGVSSQTEAILEAQRQKLV